jgi:ABC-type sugar transport system ATPase subunit
MLSVAEFAGGTPATVYVTEALGNETFVLLNLGQEKIVARTHAAVRFDIEAQVWVSFNQTKLHIFDRSSGNRLP